MMNKDLVRKMLDFASGLTLALTRIAPSELTQSTNFSNNNHDDAVSKCSLVGIRPRARDSQNTDAAFRYHSQVSSHLRTW